MKVVNTLSSNKDGSGTSPFWRLNFIIAGSVVCFRVRFRGVGGWDWKNNERTFGVLTFETYPRQHIFETMWKCNLHKSKNVTDKVEQRQTPKSPYKISKHALMCLKHLMILKAYTKYLTKWDSYFIMISTSKCTWDLATCIGKTPQLDGSYLLA